MFDTIEETGISGAASTLRRSVSCEGIGLHSGQPVTLTLLPAPAGTGILFRRTDLFAPTGQGEQSADLARVTVAATPDAVVATTLGTIIGNRHGVTVATIEHVMSALAGAGVDHAIIELSGPEVPIMDGSAAPFLKLIDEAGLRDVTEARRVLTLTRPVRVNKGDCVIAAVPLAPSAPLAPVLDITVDYADPMIGRQTLRIGDDMASYRQAVAGARTFCYLKDVEAMRAQGLALGGSLDNAIVVDDGRVLNEGGLRFDTEFVRHKALDLIGDLYLLGAPLAAHISAYKPGHELNTMFAQAVMASGAAKWVVPDALMSSSAKKVLAQVEA